MADATAVITFASSPNAKDLTFNHYHLYGTIAITAGTYPAGGIPLNWKSQHNQSPQTNPSYVDLSSIGSPPGVYDYTWDGNNLRILESGTTAATASAPFMEFVTNANIPAPILNDSIQFHAIFRRS